MTHLRYIIAPGSGAYLGHLFHSLVQGGKPDSEALAILNRLIANDSTISPPLPPGSQLRLIANTGLVVEAADGSIYSPMSFYIPRVALPLDQPVAVAAEVRSGKRPGSGNQVAGCKAKAGQNRKIRRLPG